MLAGVVLADTVLPAAFAGASANSNMCAIVCQIVQMCEDHAGWSAESSDKYSQATVDVEVDCVPRLKAWVLRHELLRRVSDRCLEGHAKEIYALDDLFVSCCTVALGTVASGTVPALTVALSTAAPHSTN